MLRKKLPHFRDLLPQNKTRIGILIEYLNSIVFQYFTKLNIIFACKSDLFMTPQYLWWRKGGEMLMLGEASCMSCSLRETFDILGATFFQFSSNFIATYSIFEQLLSNLFNFRATSEQLIQFSSNFFSIFRAQFQHFRSIICRSLVSSRPCL
jgi:hypothetical protein